MVAMATIRVFLADDNLLVRAGVRALLAGGAAGYGYLLKDRLAEGNQLVDAVRTVAMGGTALHPAIVDALTRPIAAGLLRWDDEDLLAQVAAGRTIKAIAATRRTTPEAVANDVERLFLELAQGASAGQRSALSRLRQLHRAIVDREEQGERLSRLLPGGVVEKLRSDGRAIGESERHWLSRSTVRSHNDDAVREVRGPFKWGSTDSGSLSPEPVSCR
jgi:hypothetical protein